MSSTGRAITGMQPLDGWERRHLVMLAAKAAAPSFVSLRTHFIVPVTMARGSPSTSSLMKIFISLSPQENDDGAFLLQTIDSAQLTTSFLFFPTSFTHNTLFLCDLTFNTFQDCESDAGSRKLTAISGRISALRDDEGNDSIDPKKGQSVSFY